jgi:hypothetical protein
MKGKMSAVLLFALVSVTKGNILTVSNDVNKPAQFNTIAAAFSAAAAGDTIYLYGSSAGYGDITIDKSITIIGNGFNTRKEFFHLSLLNLVRLSNDVSNVTIDGVSMARFIPVTTSAFNYTNITIRNSHIFTELRYALDGNAVVNCSGNISNWLIDNCIIYRFNLQYNSACAGIQPATSGFLVKNSLIGYVVQNHNVFFSNCQFGLPNFNSCSFEFQANRDCSFENCTFIKMNFQQFNTNMGNVFNNCLTHQTGVPSPDFDLQSWTGGSTGTANNCIINQNPLFIMQPVNCNILVDPVGFAPTLWDPAINAGSPALNAGTGGTHIGLTGGLTPYSFHGEPNLPVVRRFQLINSIVPPNGTVTLKATATKAQ